MERCQEPTQRAQQAVQQELQHVQESLSRLTYFLIIIGFPFQNVETWETNKHPWCLGVCCNAKTRLRTRWAWETLELFTFVVHFSWTQYGGCQGWPKHPGVWDEKIPRRVWDLRHCLLWQVIAHYRKVDNWLIFKIHFLSRSIGKMPNLLIKLKDAFESGKL